MQNFVLWNRDEIVQFIKSIEMAEATGASQVTYAGGGGMTLKTTGDMYKTKRQLYKRLGQIDGQSYGTGTRPRTVEPVFKNGYGHSLNLRRNPFGGL